MKFKLFGLTIEIKKKVSLEKRLIKKYGKRAYDMALIYCKNLTGEGLEETCELAKTNITIFAEAMHEGDVLPTRASFDTISKALRDGTDRIRDLEDKCNYLKNLIKSKNAAINNLNARVYNDKTHKEEQDKKIRDLEDKCNYLRTVVDDQPESDETSQVTVTCNVYKDRIQELEMYNERLIRSSMSDIEALEDEIKRIKTDKNDADGLIEKMLVKIAEYEEAINKLSNETTEPTV